MSGKTVKDVLDSYIRSLEKAVIVTFGIKQRRELTCVAAARPGRKESGNECIG